MAIFGAGFAGPVLHHWYKFLDRKIQLSTPFRSLLGRVAVDQLCFAPCFIASFFVGQGLLAGASKQTIQARLEKVSWLLRLVFFICCRGSNLNEVNGGLQIFNRVRLAYVSCVF